MPVLEKEIREKVIKYAKSKRWLVIVIDYAGWPDRLFISPIGEHVWIEFKSPTGRLSLRQNARYGILKGQNCIVYQVSNVEYGKQIVDLYCP